MKRPQIRQTKTQTYIINIEGIQDVIAELKKTNKKLDRIIAYYESY